MQPWKPQRYLRSISSYFLRFLLGSPSEASGVILGGGAEMKGKLEGGWEGGYACVVVAELEGREVERVRECERE